ncbi:MAG: DUF116 domain-containing protein [Clostridia bacterium]|nr:DUF116 domain-containing protein [Clostridia bacterium]
MRIKKRLFIGLLILSLVFITAVLAGGWYLGWYLMANNEILFNRILLALGIFTLVIILLLIALGIVGLVLIIWRGRNQSLLQRLGLMAVNALFPIALALGSRLGVKQATIKASFIEMNNQLVRLRGLVVKPDKILILAPHCLQWSGCPHKITIDANNCRRCGKCPIHNLHYLVDKYGVALAVATGGTLARHFVKQYHPQAVVAIACERDLTSGIQDTQPLAVLGILNERPNGPCLDTQVNLKRVEEAIQFFLYPRMIKESQMQGESWHVESSI